MYVQKKRDCCPHGVGHVLATVYLINKSIYRDKLLFGSPSFVLYNLLVAVHLFLWNGEQAHTLSEDAVLRFHTFVEVEAVGLFGIAAFVVHVKANHVAAFAAFMPGGIYPAIAFGHVGHTPTTHVKVVFAFIRQLNQALAIDNLQQQFLVVLQVAYIYLAFVASIFGALFGAV